VSDARNPKPKLEPVFILFAVEKMIAVLPVHYKGGVTKEVVDWAGGRDAHKKHKILRPGKVHYIHFLS